MKKLLLLAICAAFGLTLLARPSAAFAEETARRDFSDNFESYAVTGDYVENDDDLTARWENNVFNKGESVGMDSHVRQKAKIEYENGTDGNKVMHLDNTTGTDSFFYMGPRGDYRVKNFTVEFKLKFLAEGVPDRTWVGINFRKKSNVHYTGTQGLLFYVQRYRDSAVVTSHAEMCMGGSTSTLEELTLYGDRLSVTKDHYAVSGGKAEEDLPWITVRFEAEDKTYRIYVNDALTLTCNFDVTLYDYYGYLSLNACRANVLVDDFTVTVNDQTPPPEITELATPVLTLDEAGQKITWQRDENAGSYAVTVNGKTETVFTNEYSLKKLTAGEYRITVTAKSYDYFEFKDSQPSAEIVYTVAGGTSGTGSTEENGGCSGGIGACAFLPFALAAIAFIKRR